MDNGIPCRLSTLTVVLASVLACGCVANRGPQERDTYKELCALPSDGDRQPYVWEFLPEFSVGDVRRSELDGLARYYRDYPTSDGSLKLDILMALGAWKYDDSAFCAWLLRAEGLSRDREFRGFAWYFFCDKIKFKAPESDLKLALELSFKYPGVDIDGSARSPDKLCIEMIRQLGALHYPDSTWWKDE